MPIFEYVCGRCGEESSFLVMRGESETRRCENCGGRNLRRIVSRVSVVGGSTDESALRARPRDFLERPERFGQAMKAFEKRTGSKLNSERIDGAMHRLFEAKRKM